MVNLTQQNRSDTSKVAPRKIILELICWIILSTHLFMHLLQTYVHFIQTLSTVYRKKTV